MFNDDIRISIKKVLDNTIRQVYQKYKWQPTFKIIEDLVNYRILIRFRIGLTDFAMDVDAEHLDPNYLAFWGLKFEEEFLKCEEKAKARLAYDGREIIDERISDFYRRDRNNRITRFEKLLADEKKHKRFLRKKFVERIREIL
jgi:hypothetical protein